MNKYKKRLKIAILSNITLDLLAPYIKEKLNKLGFDTAFYVGGFNQYTQEILTQESGYYSFNPDFTILFIEGGEAFKEVLASPFRFKRSQRNRIIKENLNMLNGLADKSAEFLPNNIMLLNNIIIPPVTITGSLEYNSDYTLQEIGNIYNRKLSEFAGTKANLFIVDYVSLVTYHGYKNFSDNRLAYLARMNFDKNALDLLAGLYINYIKAIKGIIRKCIVVDIDNTLWGGIIGEDGIEGIKLGEDGIGRAYRDFQRELLNLTSKGIILAINSKNNYKDVKEVFKKHPYMVLKEKDFAAIRINWQDKMTNMNEIVEELNIGLNSLVFIDDNPIERELIKKELPSVFVPDMPTEPCYLRNWLLEISNSVFNKISLTEEDIKRTKIYKVQVKRERLKKTAISMDDFYKSLEMRVIIKENDTLMISRIAQLTQKTNQFNLTTRRYTESDIKNFMNESAYKIYSAELIDKFGTNGIVILMILKKHDKDNWHIDAFLQSCRVIGRTLEDTLLWYVVQKMKEVNCKYLIGEYILTEKNLVVKDLFHRLGFKQRAKVKNSSLWELYVMKNKLQKSNWIKII